MDLLLSRYSNIDFVLKLNWISGIELKEKASQEKQKEKLFSIWLAVYPYMNKKDFVSFEQFYEKCKPQNIAFTKRSADEMLTEAKEFRKTLGKEW